MKSLSLKAIFTKDPYSALFFLEDVIEEDISNTELKYIAFRLFQTLSPLLHQEYATGIKIMMEGIEIERKMEEKLLEEEIFKIYDALIISQHYIEEEYGFKETIPEKMISILGEILYGNRETLKKIPYEIYDILNSIQRGGETISHFELIDCAKRMINKFHTIFLKEILK